MADTMTASQLLADAQKQQAEINAKVDALLKQTRDEDLATAKRVITLHGFTATDLRPALKTTRGTAAKKAAATKSTSRRKPK